MEALRVAVVGCGIGGAAAAALLAERGHSVTVFERMPSIQPVGAGLMLQPSGQAVLEHMGVLRQIEQETELLDRIVARTPTGRTVIDLHYRDHASEARGLGVQRMVLHSAVVGKAERFGASFELGTEIVSVDDESSSTEVAPGLIASPWSWRQTARRRGCARARGARATESRVRLWRSLGGRPTSIARGELRQVVRGTH